MSSAITNLGQTRINQLRGAEQPLIIDRMVLALIPGLDPALPVDRAQQMPAVGNIVHTAIIDAGHKGYVNPDQVVYSVILGTDIGDFSFNWIGLLEAETDTVIAITTTPDTPKRKTNLATNTTGNNITRNFMIQFLDAANLTGVTVDAETWQFDYQAELAGHIELVVDPAQEGTGKKHVTNSQAKVWQDHVEDPHDYVPSSAMVWPGMIAFFARQTAPVGFIKANGAAIAISAYSLLAENIYCGDADNATALWGYKCTNPASPDTTRLTTGEYIVIPDLRGEFFRGFDDSRGIDAGRTLGSFQDASRVYDTLGTLNSPVRIAQGVENPDDQKTDSVTSYDPISSSVTPAYTRKRFGVRPRNIALLACIKY